MVLFGKIIVNLYSIYIYTGEYVIPDWHTEF